MTDVQKESLKQIIKSANGFSEEEAQAYIEQLSAKDAGGDNPVSDIEKGNVADKTLPDNQENTMSEMIEKSAVEALIQKALEEKQAEIEKAVAEKESKIEELTKSLQAFEAEKAEAKKAEYVAKAADFEVLGVEDKESFGVALMKMSEQEELAGVMAVLEKAVQIAKGVEGLGEVGHDLEPEEEQISKTAELLKAKYGNK
jgi:vacuolar-type H+-ATPase subunit I/STV1